MSELWDHRDEWSMRRPTLDLQRFSESIGYYVHVETVDPDSSEMMEARSVMKDIDPEDSEFLALAPRLRLPVWSHDKHFLQQKRVEVVSRHDLLKKSIELPSLWEAPRDDRYKDLQASGRARRRAAAQGD